MRVDISYNTKKIWWSEYVPVSEIYLYQKAKEILEFEETFLQKARKTLPKELQKKSLKQIVEIYKKEEEKHIEQKRKYQEECLINSISEPLKDKKFNVSDQEIDNIIHEALGGGA